MRLTVNGRLIKSVYHWCAHAPLHAYHTIPRVCARVCVRACWCTMSQRDFGAEHEIDSVVRGHHAYKAVWKPVEGEIVRLGVSGRSA